MQCKLEKDKEHSAEVGEKIADADEKLSIILLVRTSVLDNKGKKTLTGVCQGLRLSFQLSKRISVLLKKR